MYHIRGGRHNVPMKYHFTQGMHLSCEYSKLSHIISTNTTVTVRNTHVEFEIPLTTLYGFTRSTGIGVTSYFSTEKSTNLL